MFEIVEKEQRSPNGRTVIKVVGVGGAGGNAVNHMINEGVQGRRIHRRQHRCASLE